MRDPPSVFATVVDGRVGVAAGQLLTNGGKRAWLDCITDGSGNSNIQPEINHAAYEHPEDRYRGSAVDCAADADVCSGGLDLAGNWAFRHHQDRQERAPGPDLGDVLGPPLNAEGKARALSYTAPSSPCAERQCLFSSPGISGHRAAGLQDVGRFRCPDRQGRGVEGERGGRPRDTNHLDGWRPHPTKYAAHTMAGFTTCVLGRGCPDRLHYAI